jgi:protein associated with RNAse G/E
MAAMPIAIGDRIQVRKLEYVSREQVYAWQGVVVAASNDCVVVRASFAWSSPAEPPVVDGVALRLGDIFNEYYYLDRWYNIFHIADAAGRHKGWYCNVTEPAMLEEAGIAFVDLCLDLFVHPDGTMTVLDEDEFAAATSCAHCPDDPVQARAALDTLMQLAREGALPRDTGALPPPRGAAPDGS